MDLEARPLTLDRWPDLEKLFGSRGACGGCWCMFWRLPRARFVKQKGARNKAAFRRIVNSGPPPGLLGYRNGEPVAWCALAPRDAYPVLDRSRILKRVDERPVWSIVCLFVDKRFRRSGVATRMIDVAKAYARTRGAAILEAYPVEPKTGKTPDIFAWTGFASSFRRTGFEEVARRSPTRPIMRCVF